jgi:hypothetical protein
LFHYCFPSTFHFSWELLHDGQPSAPIAPIRRIVPCDALHALNSPSNNFIRCCGSIRATTYKQQVNADKTHTLCRMSGKGREPSLRVRSLPPSTQAIRHHLRARSRSRPRREPIVSRRRRSAGLARSLIPRQTAFDSITSPTRARIDRDTMSPSVLAILRLTTRPKNWSTAEPAVGGLCVLQDFANLRPSWSRR